MATVSTDQGEFEVCDCGNAEGHVGPVYHPGQPIPSGAVVLPESPVSNESVEAM